MTLPSPSPLHFFLTFLCKCCISCDQGWFQVLCHEMKRDFHLLAVVSRASEVINFFSGRIKYVKGSWMLNWKHSGTLPSTPGSHIQLLAQFKLCVRTQLHHSRGLSMKRTAKKKCNFINCFTVAQFQQYQSSCHCGQPLPTAVANYSACTSNS